MLCITCISVINYNRINYIDTILIILITAMTSNSKSYLKLIRSDKVTFTFSLSYPGYLRCHGVS